MFLNGAALNAYVGQHVGHNQAEESVASGSHHEDSAYNSFSDPKELDYFGLIQEREEEGKIPISHFRENPLLAVGERVSSGHLVMYTNWFVRK